MGQHSVINKQHMKAYKHKLGPVNSNVYIKLCEILSICSQDIEWKRNLGVNKGHNSDTNA